MKFLYLTRITDFHQCIAIRSVARRPYHFAYNKEMNIYLTIIISITIFFLLWYVAIPRAAKGPKRPELPPRRPSSLEAANGSVSDNFLVKTYQQRPNYIKRVVLVIESFENVEKLLGVLRNILNQEIRVDSIILISSDRTLKKNGLVRDTCILNKVGGLSFLFKESGNDTILVFIFPEGFNAFSNPYFLKKFIETNETINGIVKVESSNVKVDINKIY